MQKTKGRRCENNYSNRKTQENPKITTKNVDIDDINHVKYLLAVNINDLLQKVRAAIFLSLDELWSILTELVLVATILDPQFKNFHWDSSDKAKIKSHELLQ